MIGAIGRFLVGLPAGDALAASGPPPNLVLISMDTVRADALSCYGLPPGPYRVATDTTPTLDAFADAGVRFAAFFANAPSTLSSHATMMTGFDPHGHAVVRNGFPLDAQYPTLAERLSSQGYDTVAVIGSAALEERMGLGRGFRVYDDAVHKVTIAGVSAQAAATVPATEYQSTADEVVARTLAAVDARPEPGKPLFLFSHFYDAHAPYTPPASADRFGDPAYTGAASAEGVAFRTLTQQMRKGLAPIADVEEIASLYLGEVGFVDEQIGVLLTALGERGLLDHTLVVVVADHGETLGDEALYAWSHGSNVGFEVVHVPLLMRGYGVPLAEHAVVRRQAGMNGLARTLEELLGLPGTLGDGVSFADSARPGPVRDDGAWPERAVIPVFVEATRPRQAESPDGWNNRRMHRGVLAGGWGGFWVPFASFGWRFYGWGRAPDTAIADTFHAMLAGWDARAPGHRAPAAAPDTTKALKALGYVE